MKLDVQTVIHWIGLLQQLQEKGQPAIDAVKQAMAAHGVEADNAILDNIVIDAARQRELTRQEAAGDVVGAIVTGSTGE